MHPYNVTLDKRGPKAQAERRRCEVSLGGSGGMPPGKFLNLKSLKCHLLDFGGRFDRYLMVRKRIITCRNLQFG